VKALVDEGKRYEGKRSSIKAPLDPQETQPTQSTPVQTTSTEELSAQTASLVPVDEQTAPQETPLDPEHIESKGTAAIEESPIEAATNLETLNLSQENSISKD
jgi:hypothetical protein